MWVSGEEMPSKLLPELFWFNMRIVVDANAANAATTCLISIALIARTAYERRGHIPRGS